ncbi:MAG: UDP-N-acetylmuramoyl-tripeptide--D-alanyl-D-alanine ligase [Lachnospiraceae bacterium]
MKPIKVAEIVKATGGVLRCGEEAAQIEEVLIDSRTQTKNGLFVPIVGEKTDGHRYIEGAVANGATAVFLAEDYEGKEEALAFCREKNVSVIEVTDTIEALQSLASWYRDLFNIPVVGITGSVGKTTTKEMVSAALKTTKHVLKTIGNKNSQIGLPLMMFYLDDSYDMAVIEMGMSDFGEMARLADVAKPECAVVTNIGVAHIAQLKTQENIRKEKLSIVHHFVTGSSLFLNGNDRLLKEAATQITQKRIIMDCNKDTSAALERAAAVTYGISDDGAGFDFCAKDIKTTENGTCFTAVYEDNGARRELPVELKVYGEHNVMNALAALAVAKHYGIEPEIAAEGLKEYEPIAMRGQMKTKDGITWIDDTYNASPDSMRSSAQVLVSLEHKKRRVAVFADVLELGEQSEELHRNVGSYLAGLKKDDRKLDLLVTVGKEAGYIAEEAKKSGSIQTVSFDTNTQAVEYLRKELRAGDAVLVKGSRGMKTDEIIAAFLL